MNKKHLVALFALALVGMAAIAWAADAQLQTKKPAPPETRVTAAVDDDAPMLVGDAGDDDGDDLEVMVDTDSPGGGDDGERRVIVRRFAGGMGRMGMQGMRGEGVGHGRMMALMAGKLGLDDAQRGKLRDIHERQMRHDIQARADLQIGRLDLRKVLHAEKPDAGAINSQIDKLARMRADLAKSHVAAMLEARSVLTPEQQKKMRELHERGAMMDEMGPGEGHPGMMHGMGMGPGGRGMRGMGPGDPKVRVHIVRDTIGGSSD